VSRIRGESVRENEKKQDTTVEDSGGPDLTCPKCGKEYRARRSWFNKHVEECGKSAGGGWSCPKCGKQYKSKAGGWYQNTLTVVARVNQVHNKELQVNPSK
jgi:uncharacterized C2H2 Zn-finger protein